MNVAGLPRIALALVGLLVVVVIAGVIVLRPDGSTDAELSDALRAPTYQAEVAVVKVSPCPPPQQGNCTFVATRLADGPDEGQTVSIPTGAPGAGPDLNPGDEVRLSDSGAAAREQGLPPYSFSDFERRSPMLWLLGLFAAIVIVFGRRRGALALLGLASSIGVVLLFLIPAVLDGRPILPVALVASLAVMLLTLGLAHGVGPKSIAAALGTAVCLLLTAVLAIAFTKLANLTGFSSEEALILQEASDQVSVQGLVIAGMIIAALGVLDDVTVSQASAVMALRRADPALSFKPLYHEAIDVGRDHVAATVNTLMLAYVGASLPIMLVFAVGDTPFADAVNKEAVSEAVIGTLVGSIGLIAAVPITTAAAAALAIRMHQLPPHEAHAH
ncbi:MAG: YibE/F family protein [Solirubrobacteraceae bacterium]